MSIAIEPSRHHYRSARPLGHEAVAYVAAAADFVLVLAASIVGVFSYHYLAFDHFADPGMNVGIGLLTAAIFVLAMTCLHAYRYDRLSQLRHQFLLIAILIPGVVAFLLTVIFFLKLGDTFSRGAVLYLAVLSIVSLNGARLFWRKRLTSAIVGGWVRPKKAFFVCPEDLAADRLQEFTDGGRVEITQLAGFSDAAGSVTKLRTRLSAEIAAASVDEIVVVWRNSSVQELADLLADLRRWPLPVKVVFDNFTGAIVSCNTEAMGGAVAFQVQSSPLSVVERAAKRTFDVLFALTALVLLSPILLIVAVAIKLDSEGPVLFLQRRRGHANRPFRIVKFRSMSVLEDGAEIRQATAADSRVTRVGAFIRAFSIDELPQFFNVLKGDMSVVGPRPHAIAHDDLSDGLIAEYASRRHVRPGVTGWAQIHGHRGETLTVEAMEQRVRYDRWYIDNWSLWLDLKIVVRTVFALRGY